MTASNLSVLGGDPLWPGVLAGGAVRRQPKGPEEARSRRPSSRAAALQACGCASCESFPGRRPAGSLRLRLKTPTLGGPGGARGIRFGRLDAGHHTDPTPVRRRTLAGVGRRVRAVLLVA